jgi:hypothetical protein
MGHLDLPLRVGGGESVVCDLNGRASCQEQ